MLNIKNVVFLYCYSGNKKIFLIKNFFFKVTSFYFVLRQLLRVGKKPAKKGKLSGKSLAYLTERFIF